MRKPSLSAAMPLALLPPEQLKWVQNQLKIGGYYKGEIDGICGPKTLNAFNEFKEDAYLGQLGAVGLSSIDSLSRIEPRHSTTEQSENLAQPINRNAGQKTGASARLPLVGQVWADQYVDPDFPFFTWGELTKNLTRVPNNEQLVRSAIQLVRVCGEMRRQMGTIWVVTSAYRPPAVNRAVGGVPNSLHTQFRAVDVHPVNSDYSGLIQLARKHPGIGGIGFGQRRGFVHLDLGFDVNDRTPVKREFGY